MKKASCLAPLKDHSASSARASWKAGKVKEALQDGFREWITVIGCVCGDGSSLSPGIIYQEVKGIQSTWLQDVDSSKHYAFFSHSPSE
jgi:hypothetical protein